MYSLKPFERCLACVCMDLREFGDSCLRCTVAVIIRIGFLEFVLTNHFVTTFVLATM